MTTTQKGARNAIHPIHRLFRTRQTQLRYPQLSSKFYSDTMFASTTSIHHYTRGQIFINDLHFSRFIPMKSKADAGNALMCMIQDIDIPFEMHIDGGKEENLGQLEEVRKACLIKQTQTEPYSPWQNRAESGIRELKKMLEWLILRSRSPEYNWDFFCVYASDVWTMMSHPLPQLEGRTPYEHVTGNTPDISEYLDFSWYAPV
jgi:hypothetical protein